jgi:WD40 repeat protein
MAGKSLEAQVFCGHKGVVMCVQLSLCGSGQLVSGSEDKTIRVWYLRA